MEWPNTVAGWLGIVIAAFVLSGAGSIAGIYRWTIRPLLKAIADEAKERRRAIEDEAKERRRDFERLDHPETGRITLHRQSLKQDIDAVGGKVNDIVKDMTDREARTRGLENRMRDSEQDRLAIHREQGTHAQRIAAMEDKIDQVSVNIIGSIQQSKEETLRAVASLGDRVAGLATQVAVINDRQERQERDR